jgi:hypothetical protein
VIRTRRDLIELSTASIYWDKHFVLANDLDMYYAHLSIGVCPGSPFSGTFEGNGHAIRNLSSDIESYDWPIWNGGLFGYVTGQVRNLTVENSWIRGGMNCRRIGVLAGTNDGVVRNCSVTGSIAVGENNRFIGEFIGANNAEVIDCNATVTIEAGEGSTDIGGLVGAEQPPL